MHKRCIQAVQLW